MRMMDRLQKPFLIDRPILQAQERRGRLQTYRNREVERVTYLSLSAGKFARYVIIRSVGTSRAVRS